MAHSRDRLSAIIDRYDAEKKVERNKFDSVLARTEELLKTADSYPDDAQRTAFVAQVHHWALTEIEAILARELAGAERTKVDIEGETASLTKQFMSESPGGRQAAAPEMYRYLVAKGFTPAQAAGILGNIHVESGFNARAYNRREGAFGLCQWRGARLANLQNFARAQGKSVADWRVQLDFVSHELNGSHAGAGARLAAAGTPAQAAAVFDQYYERSSGHARGRRIAAANAIAGY
ncbi:MAG: hypothetical protein HOQ24_02040 [Mycobacteriaceae bacterium]|nr:hypothetical protein [Mycobacteriaceae bacterium]